MRMWMGCLKRDEEEIYSTLLALLYEFNQNGKESNPRA